MVKDKTLITLGLIILLITPISTITLYYAIVEGQSGTSLSGSVEGGTKITIRGTGFPSDFTTIQIMVGDYPCNMEDGIPPASTSVSCFTTDSGSTSNKQNLSIKVYHNEQPYTLKNYKFSYLYNKSPYLINVSPSTSIPSDYLYYYGIHRVNHQSTDPRDTQDILGLHVGQSLCNIIDIQQDFEDDDWVGIQCASALDQQGGKYLVYQHVKPGYAIKSQYMKKTSLIQGQEYEHVILPTIDLVSPNTGLPQGQDIVIEGTGFSQDESKVTVSVDGVNCDVTDSTINQISCRLAKKVGSTSPIPTNAPSQLNGFIAGSGFHYKKYQISDLADKSYSGLKSALQTNSLPGVPLYQGIKGQLEILDETGMYGKVLKGYFYAPVSGDYIFRGSGDDNFGLYISDYYGTAQVGNTPYIYQNYYTLNKDNYYISNITSALGQSKYLEAGKYYYMELYLINIAGSGYVKISVEVPNTNLNLLWQRHEVNQIETEFTNDPEIRKFRLVVDSPTSGSQFKLSLTQKQSALSLQSTTTQAIVPYNATQQQFKAALEKFSLYNGYGISVTLDVTDSLGNPVTSDIGEIYEWTVSIWKKRTDQQVLQDLDYDLSGIVSNGSSFEQLQEHPHGDLISGTFGISVGNQQVQVYDAGLQAYTPEIPYNVDAWTLQVGFRRITGLQGTQVVQLTDECQYGCKYLISFKKYNNDIPDLVMSSAMLSGGKSGTSPLASFFQTRKYSTNLLFNPVDQRMMFTQSNVPNVHVTINQVMSACTGTCQYNFPPSGPSIQSQSISGNLITVGIQDPLGSNYDLSKLTVTVGDQPCDNLVGNFDSFTCQLPLNSDGSPTIQAGSHNVEIWVAQQGKIQAQTGVPSLDIPLVIDNISPLTGGTNGGYDITINGDGFPLNNQEVEIDLCGTKITPSLISNIQTTFTAPQCPIGTQTLTYTYNGLTQTYDFEYVSASISPTISSIFPHSASPVLKDVMEIQGSNFPLDSNDMTIYLANNSGNIYQMRILENNDTHIKCGIPGGLPGNFQVLLNINGQGNAIANPESANDFVYELVITNISPNQGQYNGGTLITITGRNFSPDIRENLVTVGHELNWLCAIQTVSQTEITCRTPPYHQDWTSNTQDIILTNRLIIDNTCEGDCSFTYQDQSNSLSITSISASNFDSGSGSLTIYGNNFGLGNIDDLRVVFINELTEQEHIQIPSSKSDKVATVDIPTVEGGFYLVKMRLDPIGETNTRSIKIQTVLSQTQYIGSINGGSISLKGNGLPDEWPSKLWSLQISSQSKQQDVKIISTTPTNMEIQVSSGQDEQIYSILLINPLQQQLQATFTQKISSTPQLTLITSSPLVSGTHTLQFSVDSMNSATQSILYRYNVLDQSILIQQTFTRTADTISSTMNLVSGKYKFKLWYDGIGWAIVNGQINISLTGTYTVTNKDTSYAGGQLEVLGDDINPSAVIRIGGFEGKYLRQQGGNSIFQIPPLITPQTVVWYPSLKNKQHIIPSGVISDGGISAQAVIDGRHHTQYISNNEDCYIGIDVGANRVVNPQRIRYFPYSQWAVVANYLKGAIIQASKDDIDYDQLSVVGPEVHSGWNSFVIDTNENYRYFRLRHTNVSQCKLGQFQVIGTLYNDISATTNTPVDVIFDDGANQIIWSGLVTYRRDTTPVIQSISDTTGSIYGGYDITLTGLNLGDMQIQIDGIQCLVQSQTTTSVVCTVGERLTLPQQNTFEASLNKNKAIIQEQFIYVMRWSDIRTWGTDLLPVQGDLVYVPKGMTLYVDQTTPILEGIVIQQGKIIFADEANMQIHTGFITINEGQFRAGTKDKPYQNQLKFVMYGSYHGTQQPMFGNKGIGCKQCKFSMYGKQRPVTWTMLQNTVHSGDTTLEVIDNTIDWVAGEKIVIASTDFDHNEAQQKTIISVSGTTITVAQPFVYKHYAGIQTYGSDTLEMRAEVGLLSRNIKMMGDSTSEQGQYGSHLMMAGSAQNGMVSHIGYSEFTHCGQPRIVGRYCIHFHMNGDVVDSQVTGNSVHHSFARVLTLHAIHYLRVKDNVGYLVKGHNFFIQDGIETHNVLDHNLAISSLQTFNMMQTDTSVASFWVTNPLNDLINNHAAGGDFYAYWYEVKQHPDGPSANQDICPIGNPLGASHDNVAHSYLRFGLRIFKLYSRDIPCEPIRNDELQNPWSQNPSIQSRFYNYVTYKIGEAGVLAQEVGNMIFENFTIAQSKHAGIQFYRTNLTSQFVVAKNIAIIGISQGNAAADTTIYDGAKGVIGPRTSGWRMQDIRFYDFLPSMTVFQTCSKCDNNKLYSNRALEYFVSQISYSNISGSYLHHQGLKRAIIYDTDASFSSTFDSSSRSSATLVYNYPHLAQQTSCVTSTSPSLWDNSITCDETITLRGVTITNLIPHNSFKGIGMKIQLISSLDEIVDENSVDYSEIYSLIPTMQPKDKKFSYSIAYATGRIYNIWWLTGIDFEHLAIQISNLFNDNQEAIRFRFNYTQNRELFQIGDLVQKKIVGEYRNVSEQELDPTICDFGDYTHNNQIVDYQDTINSTLYNDTLQRNLTICLSSRGKNTTYQYLDVNGIKCRYLCPSPTGQFIKQQRLRYWSHASDWPSGSVPTAGENVTIQGPWTMIMDMQPAQIEFLHIDGDLIIPDTMAVIHIVAYSIWIRAGSLQAGNAQESHPGKITIQILGNKADAGYVITPQIAGTKLFVVHGRLHLYGQTPTTSWAKMITSAAAGSTQINVSSTSGWNVGDELTIGPSYSDFSQHQKVLITGITGNTVSFTPALQNHHYGSADITINNTYGQLDTRTAVGVLTKKIKIISGHDDGWGFRLIVNSFVDGNITRKGHIILQGVQINQGGQYDTQYGAVALKTVINPQTSIIKKSTFYNCKSYCLDIEGGVNLDIRQNVFYIGRINHVRAIQIFNYQFVQNLMIAAIKRPTAPSAEDLVACYASWQKVDQTVSVIDNICQGSELHGFALGFSACQDTYTPYVNNVASSAPACFIFDQVQSQQSCMKASGIRAYACGIGQISSPPNTQSIIFENFIIADSGRAVTLRFGKQGDDRSAFFKNSYITAISRPSCDQCYGSGATDCSNNQAIRMLAVTVNGQKMPSKFGTGFDVICKQETYDAKAFLDNVQFANYKSSYVGLSQCMNNVVFKSHPGAIDMTGSHNLRNTICTDCDLETLAYFEPPNPAFLTWFGGCGTILCTGKNNYLINDHTGDFLPEKGVLISNNSQIGENTADCTYIQKMNGHYCTRTDFGILQYESIAPDFNTRIMWPVYLNYDGGQWNTSTNGWIQWQWQGNQPLNKRLGRFVSIIELSQTYNMTFQSEPPIDMRLQFQRRSITGDNSEYIIVKLKYPRPNSIQVQNRGTIIKPITRLPESSQPYLDTTVCGSNKFYYENYTVHFVITGDKNCQVRVSLTNSIQLTARFSIDYDQFFNIDGPTKFIDRMCALLKVNDTSRLKIVGIYKGSTVLVAYLDEQTSSVEQSKNHDNNEQSKVMDDLQATLMSLYQSGKVEQQMAEAGFGETIQFNSAKYDHLGSQSPDTVDIDSNQQDEQLNQFSKNNIGLIIGLVCGGASIITVAVLAAIHLYRKRTKVNKIENINTQEQKIETTQQNFSVLQFAQKK